MNLDPTKLNNFVQEITDKVEAEIVHGINRKNSAIIDAVLDEITGVRLNKFSGECEIANRESFNNIKSRIDPEKIEEFRESIAIAASNDIKKKLQKIVGTDSAGDLTIKGNYRSIVNEITFDIFRAVMANVRETVQNEIRYQMTAQMESIIEKKMQTMFSSYFVANELMKSQK